MLSVVARCCKISNNRIHQCASTTATTRSLIAHRYKSSAASLQNDDLYDNVENTDNNDVIQHHPLYPNLFKPIHLKRSGIILPNRALMGSMHTGLEGHSIPKWFDRWVLGGSNDNDHHNHDSLERMATYFQRRAQGGVGIMVTGGIAPNIQGTVGPFAAKLTTVSEMEAHKCVTEAVHSVSVPIYGSTTNETVPSRIIMQLLHTGRYAYHPFAVSASATKSPISPFKARELSISGIQQTVKDFTNAAVLAQQAGYDGVEVMGSEGYLLSQFLSPRTNFRKDKYGGDSIQNRARLPLEIVQSIRAATNKEFLIIFRISLLDLVDNGLSWDETLELAQLLEHEGQVDILNTGIGWHEARVPTIATSVPRGAFAFSTKKLKQSGAVSIPLVATNRINDPQVAQDLLQQDTSDMVSMARPFLADPDFMQKSMQSKPEDINTCIGCNQACLDHAFVGKTASCLVNPKACHETELVPQVLPPEEQLNISVVGAGPAGCAFALAAAEMGHSVTLYDSGPSIGGQFHMAKRIPGKEEFHETLRYFETQIKKQSNKITLKLNTTIGLDDMEKGVTTNAVDKWIIATGVEPRDPKIPGQDHPNVLSYIDVLKHNKPVGEKVAIIGAGGIGFDVAEFLLHPNHVDKTSKDVSIQEFCDTWGIDSTQSTRGGLLSVQQHQKQQQQPHRQLYLLQRKSSKVGATLGRTTGWIHRATLKAGNVNMMNGLSYDKIDENGHLHVTDGKTGKPHVLEVDNIVLCAGQVKQNWLQEHAPTKLQSKVYTIGGAYEAGELDAKRAIDMGTRLAYNLHNDEIVPGKHHFESQQSAEERMFNFLRKWS